MRISQDKDKYMKYYLESICFKGELQVYNIKQMAESRGQGAEYISCSFDPDDEDYKKGYVTLLFWKPAEVEDTMVYVENNMFYVCLEKLCDNHKKKKPDTEKELDYYLREIKKNLHIK